MLRPGETLYIVMSAWWAATLLQATDEPFVTYLGAVMRLDYWTGVLIAMAVFQLVTLLHGDLRPRAVAAFSTAVFWTLVGVTFLANAEGVTLLGPTMLVMAGGGYLTTVRLLRLHRDWPL